MTGTTRRTVLAGAAAAALPLGAPFGARGQGANDLKGTTVVFTSWGGAYQEAEKAAYCEPFEKATGAKVVQDGPMNVAKFRAMAASGSPDWDVVDVTGGFLEVAIKDGLLEKIDPKLVHLDRIDPRFVSDFLRVLDPEKTFTLELKDSDSAAVCNTDDGYGYVIMPLARDR